MDRTDYERLCGITLNRVFGNEPAVARALVSRFGSPGAVFSQSPDTLDDTFGPYSKYRARIRDAELEVSRLEWETLKHEGCRFVCMGDPGYPPLLRECPDAPAGLYILSGTPPEEIFGDRDSLSIVGTRDISPYGKEWTERIVASIAHSKAKPMIVSGFAIGVDITAHLAAMAFGLPTVAVLPVGIDDIYPRRHRVVAEKLLRTPGCALITDFPPGTSPVALSFLRRNRIIAGCSRATILAESKYKGGGTMTARLAAGYGREVFCLPGRIDDIRSAGCNRLVYEKIAEPLGSPESICSQLGLGSGRPTRTDLPQLVADSFRDAGEETLSLLQSVAGHISGHRGVTEEELCEALGRGYGDIAAAVSMLECEGIVCVDLLRRCSIDNKKSYLCN